MRHSIETVGLGLLTLIAMLITFSAGATTYYVDVNSANPTPPYTSWSTAATSIQTALNLAAPGDFVWVSNGVYKAGNTISIGGAANRVAVTNAITLQSVNGPGVTVIDGGGAFRCVYLTTNAMLNGFTLTNGNAGSSVGGGVYCAATNVTVTNCYVTHCSANIGGGAYSGTLYDCTLCNSSAGDYGGGASGCICTLSDCLICSNSAPTGGGVYFFEAGSLNNCVISNNSAQYGGGVYGPDGSQADCNLSNCLITLNTAVYYGGGLFNVQIKNSVISSNRQTSLSGAGGGADSVWATNCTFIGNSATMGGGAAYVAGQPSMLFNCELIGNIGGGCSGGNAVGCTFLQNIGGGAYEARLENCMIISNVVQTSSGSASYYGAGASDCLLTNCLLAENSFTGSSTNIFGGGAYDSSLCNCTVISNSAFLGGGIADCQAYNCIVYYNNGGDYGVDSSTANQILDDCCTALLPTNGIWNITNAPLFVNASAGDFHLQANSPCINSGQNAYIPGTPTDLDGNPRIVGGTVDIGAYEYQTPASVISYAFLQQYGLPTDGSVDFADLDGTGFTVYQDWIADLNPTNPASALAMLSPAATNNASGVRVSWQSVSGIPYLLQRSTNLLTQQFSKIQSVTGQGGITSYTDTSATNQVPYFYRVGVSR